MNDHLAALEYANTRELYHSPSEENLAACYIEQGAQLKALRGLAEYFLDAADGAQSGFIPGCGSDLKWDERFEEDQKALRDWLADNEVTG